MSGCYKTHLKWPRGVWPFQVRPETRRHRLFDHSRLDLKWPDTHVWVARVSPILLHRNLVLQVLKTSRADQNSIAFLKTGGELP